MALSQPLYWLIFSPMNVHRTFPGNIGEGISREAKVNTEKKTAKIKVPLIVVHSTRFTQNVMYRNI